MRSLVSRFEDYLKGILQARIVFEDGSCIEYHNREAILYRERAGRQMEIVWYFDPQRFRGRVLSRLDIGPWDPPHDGEVVSEEDKRDIERKVAEYCRRRRVPLKVTDSFNA